jgi:high-affinity Fe2+/Pb2+ permease
MSLPAKPPIPSEKRSSIASVLLLVAGGSALSIAVFLFMVKSRVDAGAEPVLFRTALSLLISGLLCMGGSALARAKSRRPPPS